MLREVTRHGNFDLEVVEMNHIMDVVAPLSITQNPRRVKHELVLLVHSNSMPIT